MSVPREQATRMVCSTCRFNSRYMPSVCKSDTVRQSVSHHGYIGFAPYTHFCRVQKEKMGLQISRTYCNGRSGAIQDTVALQRDEHRKHRSWLSCECLQIHNYIFNTTCRHKTRDTSTWCSVLTALPNFWASHRRDMSHSARRCRRQLSRDSAVKVHQI